MKSRRKMKEDAMKFPERCETCQLWNGEKCTKKNPPKGTGAGGSMEPWDGCLGWLSKDGKPHPLSVFTDKEPGDIVYVILAKRWGCNERHSYVVGAKSDLTEATALATAHEAYRGGKYSCDVIACPLGAQSDEFLPEAVIEAHQRQPEPLLGEYLCHGHYKCEKWRKAEKMSLDKEKKK